MFLKSVKFPNRYAANISRCVKNGKVSGLKTHDCHILLQQLIPIGIRGHLHKDVTEALTELGEFFSVLCSKTLRVEDLDKLERNIPLILCKLEKIFPPAFFDAMVHLAVHLPQEAKLAGPVHSRWMYPIERYLKTLKGFVCNKARPKGSIAKGYIVKECLVFMSFYVHDTDASFHKQGRNNNNVVEHTNCELSVFALDAQPFGPMNRAGKLPKNQLDTAQSFILNNCDEVEVYKSSNMLPKGAVLHRPQTRSVAGTPPAKSTRSQQGSPHVPVRVSDRGRQTSLGAGKKAEPTGRQTSPVAVGKNAVATGRQTSLAAGKKAAPTNKRKPTPVADKKAAQTKTRQLARVLAFETQEKSPENNIRQSSPLHLQPCLPSSSAIPHPQDPLNGTDEEDNEQVSQDNEEVPEHEGDYEAGAGHEEDNEETPQVEEDNEQKITEAINGKTPNFVAKDQDASKSRAIASEFPNARHRLSGLHLPQNNEIIYTIKMFLGNFHSL